MALHATGPGTGSVLVDRRPTYIAYLVSNFDIDGDQMKEEHKKFLDRETVPVMKSPSFYRAQVTGLASRSGDFGYNLDLGQRRAENVKQFLFVRLTSEFKALPIFVASSGEGGARGKTDEDEDDRGVFVEVFMIHSTPPIPKPTPTPKPDSVFIPAYIKKDSGGGDIPMFLVPTGHRFVTQNGDNQLKFQAGTIVDCYVSGIGPVTIISGQTKKTVIATIVGSSEEFSIFGKVPVLWSFDFKVAATFANKSGAFHVQCYSDWAPGMPRE